MECVRRGLPKLWAKCAGRYVVCGAVPFEPRKILTNAPGPGNEAMDSDPARLPVGCGLLTRLRAGGALWAAPFALAVPLFYYLVGGGSPPRDPYGYAPTVVSYALQMVYALAYAVAAGLAAWEGGGLRRAGVWNMAPVRSRYRVAAHTLVPVVGLAWLMLILPVSVALWDADAVPDLGALRPLGMAMVLCAVHAGIGFGVGLHLPRVVAAPLMTLLVWLLVAFSWSTEPFWIRHVSGQFPDSLMFGEQASYTSLVPHLLFAGGIFLAAAVWWLPLPPSPLRIPLLGGCAFTVALTCMGSAVTMTGTWGPVPPLNVGRAPMKCAQGQVRVCMPQATARNLTRVHAATEAALRDLNAAGVAAAPSTITDALAFGRFPPADTGETWTVGLSAGDVRYRIARAAVRFPCSRPSPDTARLVLQWAALVAGDGEAHYRWMESESEQTAVEPRVVRERAEQVRAKSAAQQKSWYQSQLSRACSGNG